MSRPLAILTALLCALLAGCMQEDSLQRILDSGQLRVVSRNSPTTWYIDKSGPTGFEFALAELFAEELGVQLVMSPAFSIPDVFARLEHGDADFAAAGLALAEDKAARFEHSAPYTEIRPQVIYVAGTRRPRKPPDLVSRSIVTLEDSMNSRYLESLREDGLPDLKWREVDAADSLELLDLLHARKAELAVVNSNEFAVQKGLYPQLRVAFDAGPPRELVWYLSSDGDNTRLLERMNAFLRRLEQDGTLDTLREVQYGRGRDVSRISSHTFSQNMRSTLPEYRDLIRQVAGEYQMDWHLLAAMAYQESHWNPLAQSPTGVRGMMMLTEPTALEMEVSDRLDPGQSLRGGARYLKKIKRRLPRRIAEPDRTFLALAAYNVGRAHLEDARVLTQRQGGDPDRWEDVKQRLPLLQHSVYYDTLKNGYARGQEAVGYVENIRRYRSILEWQDVTSSNKPQPPLVVEDYLPEILKGVTLRAL